MSSTFAEDSVDHVNNCGLWKHQNSPAYTKSKNKSVSLQNVEVGHYVEEEGCASKSNGHLSGLGECCGLQKVLHVAPHLVLQHCSMGPVLHSCFFEEGAELKNMVWGLWSCLVWAIFSVCQP